MSSESLHSSTGPAADAPAVSEFARQARRYLESELMPRLRVSAEKMTSADLWWRPNDASNSVGNLIRHLDGNVRQWIVSGVGGVADVRRRQEEFDEREGPSAEVLLASLEKTVGEAGRVIAELPAHRLVEVVEIQERRVTVLEAILHVVEHFSMHTGQAIYVAKLRSGADLGLYEMKDGSPRAAWPGSQRD